MFTAAILVSSLLALLISYSAIRKLSHEEEVVAGYELAGVPEDWLDRLATVLLAGAAGLIAGLAWAPIGIVAAGSLASYFLVAIGFHVRAGDAAHLPVPLVMLSLAVGALLLRLGTA